MRRCITPRQDVSAGRELDPRSGQRSHNSVREAPQLLWLASTGTSSAMLAGAAHCSAIVRLIGSHFQHQFSHGGLPECSQWFWSRCPEALTVGAQFHSKTLLFAENWTPGPGQESGQKSLIPVREAPEVRWFALLAVAALCSVAVRLSSNALSSIAPM